MYNANAQAKDTYRNALLKIAEDERDYNIAQQEKDEAKLEQAYANNENYILNNLIGAIDEDGNITDADRWEKVLSWYGADFSKENPSEIFENLRTSDTAKDEYGFAYQTYKDALGGKDGISKYDGKGFEKTNTGTDGNEYKIETKFSDYNTNSKFTVTVNGDTFEAEIGKKAGVYGSRIGKSTAVLNKEFEDKEPNDIWVYDNANFGKGYISFLTMDNNKTVRLVEAVGKRTYEQNAKSFANLLKANGYNVEYKSVNSVIINGDEYWFDQNMDGSCGFKKKNSK